MVMLTGTYDQGMRLRLFLRPEAVDPLAQFHCIRGNADITYRRGKIIALHLQVYGKQDIAIHPSPSLHSITDFTIYLNPAKFAEFQEKKVVTAQPPLYSGVTHFELKLDDIVVTHCDGRRPYRR